MIQALYYISFSAAISSQFAFDFPRSCAPHPEPYNRFKGSESDPFHLQCSFLFDYPDSWALNPETLNHTNSINPKPDNPQTLNRPP